MDSLLSRPEAAEPLSLYGREAVKEELRNAIGAGGTEPEALLSSARDSLSRRFAPTLVRAVNATGVLLHTNLGRAPLPEPARFGRESVEFRIATHPRQEPGPLSRVASGGELSRVALAIQVAASEVGNVPTLVFDEVDTGIGGAVAATVGRMLQVLGARRQVLCVTHLPQVAAHADHQFRVSKSGDRMQVTAALASVDGDARVDELARMLAGSEITTKTRAHARELFERHRRKDATLGSGQ